MKRDGFIFCILLLGLLLFQITLWGEILDKKVNKKKTMVRKSQTSAKRLMEEIQIINLINGLKFTKEQFIQVQKVAIKAEKFYIEMRVREKKLLHEMEKAYHAFKKEDEKSVGFTKKVERWTVLTHRKEKKFKKDVCKKINGWESEIKSILTRKQLEQIERYRPILFPKRFWSWKDQLEDFLKRIRRIPLWAWNQRKNKIVNRVIRRFKRIFLRKNKKKIQRGDWLNQKEKILTLLEKVRNMDHETFQKDKSKIINSLLKKRPEDVLREKIQEIYKMRYGKIGKIGRFLLSPYTALILKRKLEIQNSKTLKN